MINEDFEEIIRYSFDDVKKSEKLTMLFFSVYKNLFDKQVSFCEICMRNAFNEILTKGKLQIEIMKDLKNRTCIPSWNGNKYIRQAGQHFNSEKLTDEKATILLEKGFLNEDDFKKLPDLYLKDEPDEISIISEIKQMISENKTNEEIIEFYQKNNDGKIGSKKATKKLIISLIEKANEA